LAQRAVITEIDADFEGDAFAPEFDATWHETTRTAHTSAHGWAYSFVTLTRSNSR
jgi:dihydrofolate reductase